MLPELLSVAPASKFTPTPPVPPEVPLLPVAPSTAPLLVRLLVAILLTTPTAPAAAGATTPVLVMVRGLGYAAPPSVTAVLTAVEIPWPVARVTSVPPLPSLPATTRCIIS